MKSLEPATLLAGASQPSRMNGAIFHYRVLRTSSQFNVRMRKPMYICNPFFSRQRLAFEQLKNGCSRPGASEAADRGKHAYPVVVASTPPCLLIPWSHDVTDCSTANAFSLKKGGAIAPFAPPWLRHCVAMHPNDGRV